MRDLRAAALLLLLATPALAKAPAPRDPDVAAVCGKRKRCRALGRKDAGKDAAGRALSVIELSLGKSADDDCEHIEHWLVAAAPDGTSKRTKLLALCNDGYGAAGVGEDEVKVEDNRLTHDQSGGSAWRWSQTRVMRLSPLSDLAESSSGYWNVGVNADQDHWSWETFSGGGGWWSPDCGPDGEAPEGGDSEEIGGLPDNAYAYVALPQVQLDRAYLDGGWKTTALGTCAARVDSGGEHGFVVHGQPGAPGDARFAAVLDAGGDLFLEIEDDVARGPSDKWLFDDHVELWLGPEREGDYQDHCLPPAKGKPQQWGIRVADGQVFAAFGKPAAAAVRAEVARPAAGGPVRMRLHLPRKWKTITVAYSDGDDGRTQKRIIATSSLVYGKSRTLGEAKTISAGRASCRVVNAHLDAVVKDAWHPPE